MEHIPQKEHQCEHHESIWARTAEKQTQKTLSPSVLHDQIQTEQPSPTEPGEDHSSAQLSEKAQ